jgi:hypothetical protein
LYEALSYVWGDENEKLPIFISGCRFDVTINLHAALLRLRNHSMQRLLWIDAICIDQENLQEKEYQIRFMSEIYGHANRVVVWLGEQAEDSDLAFEEILVAGNKASQTSLGDTRIQQAVLALVERPWFRRIWVRKQTSNGLGMNRSSIALDTSGSCSSPTYTNHLWFLGDRRTRLLFGRGCTQRYI